MLPLAISCSAAGHSSISERLWLAADGSNATRRIQAQHLALAIIVYARGAHLAGRPVAGSGGLELAAEAAGGGDCNQGDKRREMGDTY